MLSIQSRSALYFTIVLGVLSVVVRGVLGFNQVYIRSLIGYSSVAHSGWMMCVSVFSLKVLFLYFLFYSCIVGVLFYLFHVFCVLKVVARRVGFNCLFYVNVLLITLSGLPPFVIFFFKVVVLYVLCFLPLVVCFLIFGSFLSVYYYLIFIVPRVVKVWLGIFECGKFLFLFFGLFFGLSFPLFVLF